MLPMHGVLAKTSAETSRRQSRTIRWHWKRIKSVKVHHRTIADASASETLTSSLRRDRIRPAWFAKTLFLVLASRVR